jgi:hypothetical protein
MSHQTLIASLLALPEHELIEVVGKALADRRAEVSRPEWGEAKLFLAQAHRFSEASGTPSPWEVLALARPLEPCDLITSSIGPTQEGSCCGVTLAAYAKRIICPLCGAAGSAT